MYHQSQDVKIGPDLLLFIFVFYPFLSLEKYLIVLFCHSFPTLEACISPPCALVNVIGHFLLLHSLLCTMVCRYETKWAVDGLI
jgi:hypothetical protein